MDTDVLEYTHSTKTRVAALWAKCTTQPKTAYVLRAFTNTSHNLIAASTSAGAVKLHSLGPSSVAFLRDIQGHGAAVTDLQWTHPDQPELLHTCSADSTVRGWDTRSCQQTACYMAAGHQLNCLGAREYEVAAGGQGEVIFWDRRTGAELGRLDDTHMEDVTQVRFHTEGSSFVLSSSLDGLVAVHDTRQPLGSDDAFVCACNIGTSVEELGLYGPASERVWLRTGTETLQLWEWGRAASPDHAGGEAPFADLSDAREQAAQAAIASGGRAAGIFAPEGVSYLLGAHYEPGSDQLLLMAGHDGDVAFWPLLQSAGETGGAGDAQGPVRLGPPSQLLTGGHTAIVRGAQCWEQGSGGVAAFCVTAGEDARICCWSLDPAACQAEAQVGKTGGAGVPRQGSRAKAGLVHAKGRGPRAREQRYSEGGAGLAGGQEAMQEKEQGEAVCKQARRTMKQHGHAHMVHERGSQKKRKGMMEG
ncbi:WD40-repeat-containing domain protein [Haematococcus lacustris]